VKNSPPLTLQKKYLARFWHTLQLTLPKTPYTLPNALDVKQAISNLV
jgi:hypothetical protein